MLLENELENRHPPVHWDGDDGFTNLITLQGKLLTWKVRQRPSDVPIGGTRKPVIEFSRASRLRLLKLIQTIDWKSAYPCLFITLTCPDRFGFATTKRLTQARSVFWRHIEKYLARHVSGLWRLEWKERKSGENKGYFFPHFHVIAFKVQFIPSRQVNQSWSAAIGCSGYVRTEVQGMKNEDQAAAYVAKYCGKPVLSLVIPAYLNNIPAGRQWGILRKSKLPMCEIQSIRLQNGVLLDEQRDHINRCLPLGIKSTEGSLTVFGKLAQVVGERILGIGLASQDARE